MNVVLGASGFIGFHLCNALLDADKSVVAIDNFDTTLYGKGLKQKRAELLRARGLEVESVTGDRIDWLEQVTDVDTIYNLAATAGLVPSWKYPDAYLRNNTLFVATILQRIAQRDARPTIVQASTSSVYGVTAQGNVTAPKTPASPYGISKLAAELLLSTYSENYGIPVRILRLFSVYGEHQRPDQFFSIVLKRIQSDLPITIFGDGQNTRSNVHVSDAVRALILASKRELPISIVSDVSGAESISVLQIVNRFSDLLKRTPRLEFHDARIGDQRSTKGDLESALRVLKWQPLVSFEQGSLSLVKHFQSHPEFY